MNTSCRLAIAGLLLAHLLLGIVAAWLGSLGTWTGFYVLTFHGLVYGQVVLLGSWAGLASQTLGIRIVGLVCGSSYVTGVVAIGVNMPFRHEEFPILACLVFITAAMISILFISIRRYRDIALTYRGEIEGHSSTPIRFTVKHLLVGTTLISLLLGCGPIIRSLGGESLGIGIRFTVLVASGCIMAWLVVWASLGQGRTLLRIPIAIALG